MAANDAWGQLSSSSRRALVWAGALARYRAEQQGEDPSSALADSSDLLVGMLLEHPEDSEPKILLDHFRIAPGELLPPGYQRPPAEAIERHLLAVPVDSPPPMDGDLTILVETGLSLGMSSGSPEVAELRALFAAMLQGSNPVASALAPLLEQRSTSLTEIARSTLDFVEKFEDSSDYAGFLAERHPFNPQPIDIPNYKADHGRETDLSDDMIGVRAEVDAFAYLLASRGLQPPLAVGLFGDWGSGKSFFMDAVRRRIDQLTGDPRSLGQPQSKIPFWKRIVQIQFNAWHYVEGELWASLVDHIFNQLRFKDDAENLVEQRREHWLEKLDHTRAKLARLESQRIAATRDLSAKQQQAESLRQQRDSELAKLELLEGKAAAEIVVKTSLSQVEAALEPFKIAIGLSTAGEVFDKLAEARSELQSGRKLFTTLWRDGKDKALVAGLLVGVPLFVWALSLIDVSAVGAAFGGLSATCAAALTALGRGTQLLESRLSDIESAEKVVRAEIDAVRNQLNSKIRSAEQSIREADQRLESVVAKQQDLSSKLDTIEDELKKVTPARVLTDFVAERVGSGDYRKHLGIPALIHQDFRQLANLIAQQNAEILKNDTGAREPVDNTFNRVILYIDDLDRCPDEHVVEVLQAVHLLLAFELFVVVVAVDSRWLSHALTKHFGALAGNHDGGEHATPDDYLEKIFQIPFWIKPLGDGAKRNMVQGLLRGHLTSSNGAPADVDIAGQQLAVGDAQRSVLKLLDPAATPPNLQAAALAITHRDLRFLDELAPLMGTTPRSAKRFVNLYQLVRTIHRDDPNAAPLVPPDQELLAFVLALGEGLPALGPAILEAVRDAPDGSTFETLLVETKNAVDTAESSRLDNWLETRPDWKGISTDRIADAFSKIDRFLFRVGTSRRASAVRA